MSGGDEVGKMEKGFARLADMRKVGPRWAGSITAAQ